MVYAKCIKNVSMAVRLSDNFICLKTPTYKLAKFLVSIFEPSITNKYTVKDSFNFATEIVEQDSSNFMGSLDIDSFFNNIPLEETMEICANNHFKNKDIVHGLKKK